MLVPLVAAAGIYVLYSVLKNRSDTLQAAAEDKMEEEFHSDAVQCPNLFMKWVSPPDVFSDKTAWEWNPTLSTEVMQTKDGRLRTDLLSRHGRCPSGIVM